MQWFYDLGPVTQALIATTGTWLVTALGASLVLFPPACRSDTWTGPLDSRRGS